MSNLPKERSPKLKVLYEALENLEGEPIEYNIQVHYLIPLDKWLNGRDISETENIWREHNDKKYTGDWGEIEK